MKLKETISKCHFPTKKTHIFILHTKWSLCGNVEFLCKNEDYEKEFDWNDEKNYRYCKSCYNIAQEISRIIDTTEG